MADGLIYVFTGDGKGKTSAALGVAVRAALTEHKVCWISFYKGKDWELAEKELPTRIPEIEMYWVGKGFHISHPEQVVHTVKIASVGNGKVVDTASATEHKQAATEGMVLAGNKVAGGEYWLIVLDEVLNAVTDGLVPERELVEFLTRRGLTHIVLTGRGATQDIIEMSDLVTECTKIKHPFDTARLAVRGLDF